MKKQQTNVSARVLVVKQENAKTAAFSPDEERSILQHDCVQPTENARALAAFYHQNSYHGRCIRTTSVCTAGLGYSFADDKADAVQRFLKSIKRRPGQTFLKTMRNFWTDYELFGRAYLEIVRLGGKMVGLYHMPAMDVYATKDRQHYWQLMQDGREQQFAAYGSKQDGLHELVELSEYTPQSGYYGLPTYLGALESMTIYKLISQYTLTFFSNGALADLAIIIEGADLDDKTAQEIQNFLSENTKGLQNAHKTIFIPVSNPAAKVRIEKLNDMKESSFRLTRQDCRDEIISAHGVPPKLAGILLPNGLGGGGETVGQLTTYKETRLDPNQKDLTAFLNDLFECEFGHNPELVLNSLKVTNGLQLAQQHQAYIGSGVLTANEVREELGKAPLDNTDNLLKTLTQLRKQYDGSQTVIA